MSTQDQPGTYGPWGTQPPVDGPAEGVKRTNGLGIAGFVVSLVSWPLLLACGLGLVTAPIGVIMSVVALFMKKRGKGFAIAGVVTGLLALVVGVGLLVVGMTAGAGMVQQGVALASGGESIRKFVTDNGRLPDKAELEGLIGEQLKALPAVLGGTEHFNLPFDYTVLEGGKVKLTFAGADEQLGTADDMSQELDLSSVLKDAGVALPGVPEAPTELQGAEQP